MLDIRIFKTGFWSFATIFDFDGEQNIRLSFFLLCDIISWRFRLMSFVATFVCPIHVRRGLWFSYKQNLKLSQIKLVSSFILDFVFKGSAKN